MNYIIIVLSVLLFSISSKAALKLKILGSYAETSVRHLTDDGITVGPSKNSKKAFSSGQGFAFDIGLSGPLSIEVGILMQSRGFTSDTDNSRLKYDAFVNTIIFRYMASGSSNGKDFPATIGLGFYSSSAVNDDVKVTNGTTGVTTTTNFSDATLPLSSALKKGDQGLVASAAVDFAVSGSMYITLEMRYLYGWMQVLEDNASFRKAYYDEISTLAGLTFAF